MNRKKKNLVLDIVGVLFVIVFFITPFFFMFINALKSKKEANLMRLTLPTEIHWENFSEVIKAGNYQVFRAFMNSAIITIGTVLLIVIVCSMAGYVIQRRKGKAVQVLTFFIMAGLMIPAAVLPTIWLLQILHLYKTMIGMILIETALSIPFAIILYRGYIASVPVELEEAGYIDGCNRFSIFSKIIFPLLKPITSSVVILNAVSTFNDFTNPLYFLPGAKNATIQLTLYNYMGKYASSYNLLFADAFIITLPMIILFLFFNKQIVAGMTAGSVKG